MGNTDGKPVAEPAGSVNSAVAKLEAYRRLRRARLRRYLSLKNGEQGGYVATQADHGWGTRFVRVYPRQCATCGCQTRSPFDDTMIMHDVDACVPPNAEPSGGKDDHE